MSLPFHVESTPKLASAHARHSRHGRQPAAWSVPNGLDHARPKGLNRRVVLGLRSGENCLEGVLRIGCGPP